MLVHYLMLMILELLVMPHGQRHQLLTSGILEIFIILHTNMSTPQISFGAIQFTKLHQHATITSNGVSIWNQREMILPKQDGMIEIIMAQHYPPQLG